MIDVHYSGLNSPIISGWTSDVRGTLQLSKRSCSSAIKRRTWHAAAQQAIAAAQQATYVARCSSCSLLQLSKRRTWHAAAQQAMYVSRCSSASDVRGTLQLSKRCTWHAAAQQAMYVARCSSASDVRGTLQLVRLVAFNPCQNWLALNTYSQRWGDRSHTPALHGCISCLVYNIYK